MIQSALGGESHPLSADLVLSKHKPAMAAIWQLLLLENSHYAPVATDLRGPTNVDGDRLDRPSISLLRAGVLQAEAEVGRACAGSRHGGAELDDAIYGAGAFEGYSLRTWRLRPREFLALARDQEWDSRRRETWAWSLRTCWAIMPQNREIVAD